MVIASGTVIAAALTGFGAAALKRHWDISDDQKRWLRQAAAQQRLDVIAAWGDYLTYRRELASLVQFWAVATIRFNAPAASDRDRARWGDPPDEVEIVTATMKLAQAMEALVVRSLSFDVVKALRGDCQEARTYALASINRIQQKQAIESLFDCNELSELMRRDVSLTLGAETPMSLTAEAQPLQT